MDVLSRGHGINAFLLDEADVYGHREKFKCLSKNVELVCSLVTVKQGAAQQTLEDGDYERKRGRGSNEYLNGKNSELAGTGKAAFHRKRRQGENNVVTRTIRE